LCSGEIMSNKGMVIPSLCFMKNIEIDITINAEMDINRDRDRA